MNTSAAVRSGAIIFLSACFLWGDTASPAPDGAPARELCSLQDPDIDESSGIAASVRYPGSFWTHNDSGDAAHIFLIDKNCETRAVVLIKGVKAVDWEDIAVFRMGDESYILIADTGNNMQARQQFPLCILKEPALNAGSGAGKPQSLEVEPEWTVRFSYEDGPCDCEAAAVDARESTIYLACKGLPECRIYSLPIPDRKSVLPVVARLIATTEIIFATAMDISPDGNRAVILNYTDAFLFERRSGESWAQAFSREGRAIKLPPRPQGEAICYGADGKNLYFTSENAGQPLWEMPAAQSVDNGNSGPGSKDHKQETD